MTDGMWALRHAQLGKQTALGTAVPATVALVGLMLEDQPEPTLHEYGPNGQLFETLSELGLEYSTFKLKGRPDYNELAWLLAAAMGDVAPTIPVGGTISKQRIWTPPADNLWTPMITTAELGDNAEAMQYPDLIVKGFDFTTGEDKWEQQGDAFAGAVTTGFTLTPSLTNLPEILIKGEQTKIYLNSTLATIGTTQLLRYFEHKFAIADIYAPEFPGGVTGLGYGTYVQKKPKITGQLTMEADAVGLANLTTLRAGGYAYLRMQSIGPVIEGTIHYELTIDAAIKFSAKPSAFKGVGSASALTGNDWPYTIVKDPAWVTVNASGQAFQITLVNTVAAF